MTPVEHCASAASAPLARIEPVGGDLERALAGGRHARRLGARLRCSLTPKRGFTGSNTAEEPIIMRTTMPSGASV